MQSPAPSSDGRSTNKLSESDILAALRVEQVEEVTLVRSLADEKRDLHATQQRIERRQPGAPGARQVRNLTPPAAQPWPIIAAPSAMTVQARMRPSVRRSARNTRPRIAAKTPPMSAVTMKGGVHPIELDTEPERIAPT